MAAKNLNNILQHIRKLAAVQTCRTLSDRDLLERFVEASDEAAFTVLVERHGPMVHGVCCRILRNTHDAEDACQAAFLVLARKAGSIRKKTSLSSWLHGVACRVAADLKRQLARRQRRERQVQRPGREDASAEVSWQEVQTVLDEELQLLPDRYRSPLLLCYLDGKTRDEAAQQLGLNAGSLHGRLERGRKMLRERLTRRGITLSAVLLATALNETVANAALSPTFVVSSVKASLTFSAGKPLAAGVIAPQVLSLTEGVLKAMFLSKLKIGTAVLLCASLLTSLLAGSVVSISTAQEKADAPRLFIAQAAENDEAFLRRISKDLRDREPSPAEIHFFVTSKDSNKRQKAIDLFIQERQKKAARPTAAVQLKEIYWKLTPADQKKKIVIIDAYTLDEGKKLKVIIDPDTLDELKKGKLIFDPAGMLPGEKKEGKLIIKPGTLDELKMLKVIIDPDTLDMLKKAKMKVIIDPEILEEQKKEKKLILDWGLPPGQSKEGKLIIKPGLKPGDPSASPLEQKKEGKVIKLKKVE